MNNIPPVIMNKVLVLIEDDNRRNLLIEQLLLAGFSATAFNDLSSALDQFEDTSTIITEPKFTGERLLKISPQVLIISESPIEGYEIVPDNLMLILLGLTCVC